MEFEFKTTINRPLEDVFAFFRDVDQYGGWKGSIVPVFDKTTPGPVRIGTRYYEVVQILPFVTGKVFTEVIGFETNKRLAYKFVALGMEGALIYLFQTTHPEITEVVQKQRLLPRGMLRLFEPIIGALFSWMAKRRLSGIKSLLESERGRGNQ